MDDGVRSNTDRQAVWPRNIDPKAAQPTIGRTRPEVEGTGLFMPLVSITREDSMSEAGRRIERDSEKLAAIVE